MPETPVRLRGAVQHYSWGGYEFIPGLLGVANPDRAPFAELWLGAHPSAPAWVEGREQPLDAVIASAPEAMLGPAVARRFGGQLPYLMKVLDARQMLSIQAHPTREQAVEGFEREERAGIASGAPHRNYRDRNHKPEVHVALTGFRLLHGFRPVEEIERMLEETPELRGLRRDLRTGGPRALYATIMTMPQARVNGILGPLIERLSGAGPLSKDSPDYWALHASREMPLPGGDLDRGIFSLYLLNLVRLRPGEGTFQPAGVLHAYLEGINVELMANSDNVLRGGLTPKHADAAELLKVVSFDGGPPDVLRGEAAAEAETVYRTPCEEFELSRIAAAAGQEHRGRSAHGPDTLVVLEGAAVLEYSGGSLELSRGAAAFVPWGQDYRVKPLGGRAVLWKSSIPAVR